MLRWARHSIDWLRAFASIEKERAMDEPTIRFFFWAEHAGKSGAAHGFVGSPGYRDGEPFRYSLPHSSICGLVAMMSGEIWGRPTGYRKRCKRCEKRTQPRPSRDASNSGGSDDR
jgi:hypothetical protein